MLHAIRSSMLLNNCSNADGFQGLKHACSSLAVTLAPKGRLDPMSLFPQELVTIIYENLTFRDIV